MRPRGGYNRVTNSVVIKNRLTLSSPKKRLDKTIFKIALKFCVLRVRGSQWSGAREGVIIDYPA